MIRFDLLPRADDGEVNLAWAKGFQATARTALSRLSYHAEKPTNILPILSDTIPIKPNPVSYYTDFDEAGDAAEFEYYAVGNGWDPSLTLSDDAANSRMVISGLVPPPLGDYFTPYVPSVVVPDLSQTNFDTCVASVKVDPPSTVWNFPGLLVGLPDQYVFIIIGAGGNQISVHDYDNGSVRVPKIIPTTPGAYHLRITLDDATGAYDAEYSSDGVTWNPVWSDTIPNYAGGGNGCVAAVGILSSNPLGATSTTNVYEYSVEYIGADDYTRFFPTDLLLSNRSVQHPNVRQPQELYFQHDVGTAISGTHTYWMHSKAAASKATQGEARLQLVSEMKLTDQGGSPLKDIWWDLDVLQQSGNNWKVRLYTNRRPVRGQSIRAVYTAYNPTSGEVLQNHWEVVNPTPLDLSVTYSRSGLDSSGRTHLIHSLQQDNYAPGIALWHNGTGTPPSITVDGTTISDASGPTPLLSRGFPVSDIVTKLNETFGDNFVATPLTSNQEDQLVGGTYVATEYGTVINQFRTVHGKYDDATQIEMRPFQDLPMDRPWYAQFGTGIFTEAYTNPGHSSTAYYTYGFPEAPAQQIVNRDGTREYKEISLERPITISDRLLKVRNTPILEASSVRVWVSGVDKTSEILRDVDRFNGYLYLNYALREVGDVLVDYKLEVDFYEYRGINLNPLQNPGIAGKFIGYYLLPERVQGGDTSVDVTFATGLYHFTADTVEGIYSAVNSVNTGQVPSPRLWLLGIAHPSPPGTHERIRLWDTRSLGGGLKTDLSAKDVYDESKMYHDIGRWNGEPFSTAGLLMVEFPDSLLGDTIPSPIPTWPPADSGIDQPSGVFSEEDIQQKLVKYMDAGGLAVQRPRDDL